MVTCPIDGVVHAQLKALRAGCEVAVGTPGRIVELLATKHGLCARRVTFVVLDEADRMFSLGFEPQVTRPTALGSPLDALSPQRCRLPCRLPYRLPPTAFGLPSGRLVILGLVRARVLVAVAP